MSLSSNDKNIIQLDKSTTNPNKYSFFIGWNINIWMPMNFEIFMSKFLFVHYLIYLTNSMLSLFDDLQENHDLPEISESLNTSGCMTTSRLRQRQE